MRIYYEKSSNKLTNFITESELENLRRFHSYKIIGIVIVVLLIAGYILWLLIGRSQENIDNILSEKINEYNNYGDNYTLEKAKEDGFYVEESLKVGAPYKMIRFVEFVWQKRNVDVSIAKKTDNVLLLSYIINHDKVIYVLDYNVHDKTYKISEYRYLTYDYDTVRGIQTRYLTNDKDFYGKDKLTDEQKKNCYYLFSYLIN
jgi:hypothetical protein